MFFIYNLTDFILLEREERMRICETYIDNLIERHNFYKKTININSYFNSLLSNDNIIKVCLYNKLI